MWKFLGTPSAQAVISVAVLATVLVVAYYIVRSFGDRSDNDGQTLDKALTNFREIHHQGEITDGEFRDIKTLMGAQLQSRTRDDGETG